MLLKKICITLVSAAIVIGGILLFPKNKNIYVEADENEVTNEDDILIDVLEINMHDTDGNGTNFIFDYKDNQYTAIYSEDNWRIIDSYKIKNRSDIIKICETLLDIHRIHGKDMISYRTAEDMAYEWIQHNIAYEILPEESKWRENAKDVDLDPQDQGRSFREMYEARTGKKLDIMDIQF